MAEAKKSVKKTAVKAEAKTKVKKAVVKAVQEPKEDAVVSEEKDTEKALAKVGKRSAKAVKEVEEKEAKQERKAHAREEAAEVKPKRLQKPPRSRLERRGKKYRQAAEQIEVGKQYAVEDAVALATKTSTTKFDATVELHINLNVDPKQADQNVRGTVVLPAGTGKSSRVAVVAEAADVIKAKAAGADLAGSDELFAEFDKEKLDFDVLIATSSMMPRLGKYARLLGPKGLMPNPKSGTVTADVAKAVKEAKAGKVEFRVDSTGIIHVGVGKVSFGAAKITDNVKALLSSLKATKPATVKGAFIKSIYLTTSMGPSISVNPSEA